MASKKEKQRRIKAENKANSTPYDKEAAAKLEPDEFDPEKEGFSDWLLRN